MALNKINENMIEESFTNKVKNVETKTTELTQQLADTRKLTFDDINRSRLYNYLVSSQKVTFIGDSVTKDRWYLPLQKYTSATLVNKGVGSDTTYKVLARFADILTTKADTYVIGIGTNDVRYRDPLICAMTSEDFVAKCNEMVTLIKADDATANIAFINAWTAFDKDYTSVLDQGERDNLITEYNEALRKYCSTKDIPFIDANIYIREIVNFANKTNFLLDAIHPNLDKGHLLYSNAVLFGKQHIEDYNLSPSRTSGKYIYKLKIRNKCELTRLELYGDNLSKVTPIVAWSNVNNSGYDDINNIINATTDAYTLKQKSVGDLPLIITLSTNSPIKMIKQKSIGESTVNSITELDVYRSTNKEDILYFDSLTWDFLKTIRVNVYTRELFIEDISLLDISTLSEGWSYRTGKSKIIAVKNGVLYISAQIQKTSAWTKFEPVLSIKGASIPNEYIMNAVSFVNSGSSLRPVACLLDKSGGLRVGWRDDNTQLDDCISINEALPLSLIG